MNTHLLKYLFISLISSIYLNAESNSDLGNMLGDLFFYDRQNNDKLESSESSKIDQIKNENTALRSTLEAQLIGVINDQKLDLTPAEQEKLIEQIMQDKVLANNELFSAISKNNRIAVDLVNKYFDKFIVNNRKNVFVGQKTSKSNYSKFISYSNNELPPLTEGKNSEVLIIPTDITNTVNIPLRVFGKSFKSCDIQFITSPDNANTSMSDIKIFKYRNNRINWLRLEDLQNPATSCSTNFNTLQTAGYSCHRINSHGTKYHEKIVIPGMAYIYAPLSQDTFQFELGNTAVDVLKADTKLNVTPCSNTPTNGNSSNYTIPNDPLAQTCLHYFDYIKFIINIDIDLVTGNISLVVKENQNPFDQDKQEFLMPTKLFTGNYDSASDTQSSIYSSRSPEVDYYQSKFGSDFDISDIEKIMPTLLTLDGNIIDDVTNIYSTNNCDVSPLRFSFEIKKLIEDIALEKKYKFLDNSDMVIVDPAGNVILNELNEPTCYYPHHSWNSSVERCISNTCPNGYTDNNNGLCVLNNTSFLPGSIYNYFSIN